jgi:hypothetical protein
MGVVYTIILKLGLISHKKTYIYSGLVFVLLMMQPDIITLLVSILSCRIIGGEKYIMGDLAQNCYDDTHIKFTFLLVLPSFGFWGIIIPVFLFKALQKNKNNLHTIFVRMGLGILF